MTIKPFGEARYCDGIPEIGRKGIRIKLVASKSSLDLYRSRDGTLLASVLWSNIRELRNDIVSKDGLEKGVASLLSSIPFMPLTHFTEDFLYGLDIFYWDDEVQRVKKIVIADGLERNIDKLKNTIWKYHDRFQRSIGERSGPQRR